MKRSHFFVLVLLLGISFSVISMSGPQHDAPPTVDPAAALENLKQGNARFVDGKSLHPDQGPKRREELAAGQKPAAIILSCSDSRVPPELVFDQGLGNVFAIRVAGNVLGADEVGSIEYAVEHLNAGLIVVMGHESCGAVKAALETPRGRKVGSNDLSALIATVHQNMETAGRKPASHDLEDKTFREPVKANVNGVVKNLRLRSKLIDARVKAGQLRVVPAIYSLATGRVDFWE